MKIEFPSGTTLGDDSVKQTIVVEQLAGQSAEQLDELFRGANVSRLARANVRGDFIFRSSKSYASYKATWTQWITEYARLNTQGTIVLTEGDVTVNFANAVLKGVQRTFDNEAGGVRMTIRYTFGITTIAAP